MSKERKAKNFLPKASYPGGPKAMAKFIYRHLQYPQKAKDEKIEGTVRIKLDINYKGKVIDHKVMSSLSPECDTEAGRLVRLLVFDVGRKLRKGKILFHKTVNIHFKLPKEKKSSPQSAKIQYRITKKAPAEKAKPQKSFTYTIAWDKE